MKRVFTVILAFGMIIALAGILHATIITYDTTNLGGGRWEYTYNILNDTLGAPIEEFTIYFDYGLYSDLSIDTPKANWDGLTVNPDLILGIPQPGYYDALSLVSGIAPGSTESGFLVSFNWLGTGTPGVQYFEIVNPSDFSVVDSGNTTPVPEPGTMMLLGSSLLGLIGLRRKIFPLQRPQNKPNILC